jgi:hypothetical protein
MLQRGNAYRVAPATIHLEFLVALLSFLNVINTVELYILVIFAARATEYALPRWSMGTSLWVLKLLTQ